MAKSNDCLKRLTLEQTDLEHKIKIKSDILSIEAECLKMITRFTSPSDDTDAAKEVKKTAQEGTNVQLTIKTKVEVDSDVQPNYRTNAEEDLMVQPNSKTVALEDSETPLSIKTEANEDSDVQPKSKIEDKSNVQQKSNTLIQESSCEKQIIEMEHSSPIETFKNQLNELIELEADLSKSVQLCLEIAIEQVCLLGYKLFCSSKTPQGCMNFTFNVLVSVQRCLALIHNSF